MNHCQQLKRKKPLKSLFIGKKSVKKKLKELKARKKVEKRMKVSGSKRAGSL
jgi:hypothetical protein